MPEMIRRSDLTHEGTRYALVLDGGKKRLLVDGDVTGFINGATGHFPLNAENARVLRSRLDWLNPVPLGTQVSAGFGDRLGIATPGHIAAVRGKGIAPIFAQQSVRENTRTGRTPQVVLDDAMWGVFEVGWRDPWGADADHMKTISDIAPFVAAGYTFFTIDPSAHVDDSADDDPLDVLKGKLDHLNWAVLAATLEDPRQRYLKTFPMDDLTITFDELTLYRALAKYGNAVAHTVTMAQYLARAITGGRFDLEMSVDETGTTTSLQEHFFIASELRRLGITWVSLAPRFVGRFEKGVDYIGDLAELDANIQGHAAIMRYFGNPYKLSLHTGSDKFDVYPLAMQHTDGLVHLKTAGTSYLEALRVFATLEPAFFRNVLTLARSRYEEDRKTYHVSAMLDKVSASDLLKDEDLPDLLNQFDARQVLHVTFGSVLDQFGKDLHRLIRQHSDTYETFLKRHFDRHLALFSGGWGVS